MKEKKEENYLNRRNMLIKQIDKKQQDIENKLYRIRESKEGQRKKHLKLMQKKENLAQIRKKRKEQLEENDRLRYETQINEKCNSYIYLI